MNKQEKGGWEGRGRETATERERGRKRDGARLEYGWENKDLLARGQGSAGTPSERRAIAGMSQVRNDDS